MYGKVEASPGPSEDINSSNNNPYEDEPDKEYYEESLGAHAKNNPSSLFNSDDTFNVNTF